MNFVRPVADGRALPVSSGAREVLISVVPSNTILDELGDEARGDGLGPEHGVLGAGGVHSLRATFTLPGTRASSARPPNSWSRFAGSPPALVAGQQDQRGLFGVVESRLQGRHGH
jgi:hypothetical protein